MGYTLALVDIEDGKNGNHQEMQLCRANDIPETLKELERSLAPLGLKFKVSFLLVLNFEEDFKDVMRLIHGMMVIKRGEKGSLSRALGKIMAACFLFGWNVYRHQEEKAAEKIIDEYLGDKIDDDKIS